MAEITKESKNSLPVRNESTKPMELQEIKIVEDEVQENKTEGVDSLSVFTNMGYDKDPELKSDPSEETDPLNMISPDYDNNRNVSVTSGNVKIGVDGSTKKDEREFYLYRARDGEEAAQLVAGEKVNNLEIKFVTLPGLASNIADKHQLDRLTKQFWRPVQKKREMINKFINNLVLAGDVELMQRAFIQFPNLESVISNPFSKDKKKQEDLDSLLHVCARNGTGSTMQKLLRAKSPSVPLNLRSCMTETNDSILHAAVRAQNFDTTREILEYIPEPVELRRLTIPAIAIKKHSFTRATANRSSKDENCCVRGSELTDLTNDRKDTALHISMNKQDNSLVELLLDSGADISLQDRYGNNVLHIAAINNDITAIEMIIASQRESGESGVAELKDAMCAQNKKGKKPAELATRKESMEIFLNCYTDGIEKNEQLGMLLASATERNNLELATFLVSKGASLDFESEQGVTALKLASKRGYTDLVGYILQEGSDPNYKSEKSKYTAINNATKSGHKDLVKLLINHNATLWNDQTMETSALHSAVNGGQIHLVNFLVKEYGMDPNTRDCNGYTPLYYAVRGGYKDCVKALLNCRADPELPVDNDGNKAVHQSARKNDRNILKLLLEYGARREDKEMSGKTPMDIALREDLSHILELLLEFQVTLNRQDEENNNPMHIIACFGSYKCAEFLLRQAQVDVAFEQLKNENLDGETPISIAKRKGNESVLMTFIERVPMEYFDENAKIYHEFIEEEQFDILKTIFNRMCVETNGGTEVHCRALMLDVNGKGESPFSKKFSHLLPSLLHKLMDCDQKELREHPVVKKTVEKKLNFYRIWYILTFLVYIVFLVFLSIALFLASYECDDDLKSFTSLDNGTNLRLTAETYSWVYVCLLTVSEFIEFAFGWSRIIKVKRYSLMKMRRFHNLKSDESDGETSEKLKDQTNCFIFTLELAKKVKNLVPFLNRIMFYLPQALLQYIYDSPTDLLGIISFFLYFGVRLSSANTAWIFASLSFIGFVISMLKYTRVVPSLGAYIDTVKAVFSKDIPRFMVLYLIVVAAYIGGIHLAARFHPLGSQQRARMTIDGRENPDLCVNDTSQLFFFNQDTTDTYTFLTPFVDGMILLLDGGPGNRQEDILGVNLYFAVIYVMFAFTIIVVLSNILIAQLSETYADLSAQGTFYYRMGLVVSMELESTLAFLLGKYFRQLSSIKSFNVPIDEWKDLVHNSPAEDINKQLSDLQHKLDKNSTALYEGIEKINTHEETLDKVSEKVNEVLSKMVGPVDARHGLGPKKFSSQGLLFEDRIGKVEATVERVVMQNLHLEDKLNEILTLLRNADK